MLEVLLHRGYCVVVLAAIAGIMIVGVGVKGYTRVWCQVQGKARRDGTWNPNAHGGTGAVRWGFQASVGL